MMNWMKGALIATLLTIAASVSAGPVNINTADAQTLAAELNGIGMKKAAAIVAFRDNNGHFTAVDELIKVQGIGLATVEKNRAFILLSDESAGDGES